MVSGTFALTLMMLPVSLLGTQFDLTVTNRMLSVLRLSYTHSHTLRYQSPLSLSLFSLSPFFLPTCPSYPSSFPQALPFICMSSAHSVHPSLHPFSPSPHSFFLSSSLHCLLFCLPLSLRLQFSPVSFSLCRSTAHSITPITLPLLQAHSSLSSISSVSPLSFSFLIYIHPLLSSPPPL